MPDIKDVEPTSFFLLRVVDMYKNLVLHHLQ